METNERIVRRWFQEIWNERKENVIDELAAPDIVAHGLQDPEGNQVKGIPEFKQFYRVFNSAFSNIKVDIEFTINEGDRIASFLTCTCQHTGDALGIAPTNREAKFQGVVISRIVNGRIAEAWNVFDFLTMHMQIGNAQLRSMSAQPA